MASYPPAWLDSFQVPNEPIPLCVAGFELRVSVSAAELKKVYLPLLAWLDEKASAGRIVPALAGVPGSGKSTLTGILAHLADRVFGRDRLKTVGMDGWHYPNRILAERTLLNVDGGEVPLMSRKGCPESFDAPALADALEALAQSETPIRLPAYDRRTHEPRADAILIPAATRIVLVEGNYLLSRTPPWDRVAALLSPRLFVDCEPAAARRRVIDRHIRGGCTPEQAEVKYENNDRINAGIAAATRSEADAVITLGPAPSLQLSRGVGH